MTQLTARTAAATQLQAHAAQLPAHAAQQYFAQKLVSSGEQIGQ